MSALTDRVDAKLKSWWPIIVEKQEGFRAQYGRYWQSPRSHNVTPKGGAESAPDKLHDKLDTLSWNDLGLLPSKMESCIWFDAIQHVGNFAFSMTAEVEEDGKKFRRILGHGWGGSGTDTGWLLVEEPY